jgi:hypothetical protein
MVAPFSMSAMSLRSIRAQSGGDLICVAVILGISWMDADNSQTSSG